MLAIKIVAHTLSRTQINCIFFDVRLGNAYGCYSCRVDVLTQDLVYFVVYRLGNKVKEDCGNKVLQLVIKDFSHSVCLQRRVLKCSLRIFVCIFFFLLLLA